MSVLWLGLISTLPCWYNFHPLSFPLYRITPAAAIIAASWRYQEVYLLLSEGIRQIPFPRGHQRQILCRIESQPSPALRFLHCPSSMSTARYCNVYFDRHRWRVLHSCSKIDSRRLHNSYWYQSSSPWFTGVKVSLYSGTYKPEHRLVVHFRSYRPNVFTLTFWKYVHQVFESHGTAHFPVIQKLSLA